MPSPTDPTRWDDLRVFLAVLRAGSFSGAAETLGVEQSTISRRIAQLESELGHPLFDRLPSGPRPTEIAERMRAHAERAGAEVQAIADLASGHGAEIDGRVRLAVTESFAVHVFVPHLLPELRARHPKLAVDLVSSTAAADLGQREAEIAVRFFRPVAGDLVVKRVAVLPTAVIARRSYMETRPRDPAALDWIVLELGSGARTEDSAFVAEHIQKPPIMRTNSHLLQVEAVRAGLGVAPLARSHLALDPELISVDLPLPAAPPVEAWLAAPRTLRPIPRIDALWTFLEDKLHQLENI